MRWLFAIVSAVLPAAASADELTPADQATELLYRPLVEQYCTDAEGARRELGDVICITASCQTWMARCEMSLNNPMWRKLSDGCPAVDLGPEPGPRAPS